MCQFWGVVRGGDATEKLRLGEICINLLKVSPRKSFKDFCSKKSYGLSFNYLTHGTN